jgi:hypothetical protein
MICRNISCGLLLSVFACNGWVKAEDAWTTVNDDDPAASYSPGMEKLNFDGYFHGDLHAADKVGEWASFSFTGAGVKWIGAKNHDHGQADVYIDGKLDATLSTVDPQWIKQQELYTKTGLPLGHHTLKIIIKTPGSQDFDAFAFLPLPPRAAKMPEIEGVTLPSQQPLLNAPSRYPIGNGVAALIGDADGEIETSFGPGYTTSDLGKHEDILVTVDNVEQPLRIDIKRAAGTGVYYGFATRGDLDIGIVDYAIRGEPWISRLIVFKNQNPLASHTVLVRDHILPCTGNGYKSKVAIDAAGNCTGFTIQADTTIGVPYCGTNPVDKSVVIAFRDPTSAAMAEGDSASLRTKPIPLAPGVQHEVVLTHYFRTGDDVPDSKIIDALRALDPHATLQKSITEWMDWMNNVPPAYALSKIKDSRARVLVEGALTILKTNQGQDGGVVAHTTFYKSGFVRDAAMAIRGLLATGHTNEAKQWLLWIDKKLAIHHHLGDSMSCSVSRDDKSNCGDLGNMEVEEPGWVLLVARDYYRQTHDLALLKSIDSTLRYCAEVQLKQAGANDKMPFNGDETEVCTAVDITGSGSIEGSDTCTKEWALSSVAMAAASVDFFADYIKAAGGDPTNYHNGQTNTMVDLDAEVKKLVAAMDRDFWRTDVPESPAGFHDFFRNMADGAWPKKRLANFTLMPAFFGTPYAEDEKIKDVAVIAPLFDAKTGFLKLVPGADTGMEGHDLGYLLWGCVETGDWRKEAVYHALVNGPTVDAWGAFTEAYDTTGHPNSHDLRSLETGINVSALVKYWGLGHSN